MSFTDAETYILQRDKKLGALITSHGSISLKPAQDYFEALASSIISQQISVKAAANILGRFRSATGMSPQTTLNLTEADSKVIGLSGQKFRYLRDLAQYFINDATVFNHLDTLSDDDVISELTRVKGIGIWTAQMFLIFTLHRADIFAPDDRGLQLAIEKLYQRAFTRVELDACAEQWSPYRSTACLHLWRSLDNAPVS